MGVIWGELVMMELVLSVGRVHCSDLCIFPFLFFVIFFNYKNECKIE
jgi:hypothetical protein